MNRFLIFPVMFLLLTDYKVIKIRNQSNAHIGRPYNRNDSKIGNSTTVMSSNPDVIPGIKLGKNVIFVRCQENICE